VQYRDILQRLFRWSYSYLKRPWNCPNARGAGAWCSTSEPSLSSRVRFDDLKLVASDKAAENGILFDGNPLPVIPEDFKNESGNKVKGRKKSKSSKTR